MRTNWNLAVELLREVMRLHADPDSPDYNECDTEPCMWCQLAGDVIKGSATQEIIQ